MNTKPIRVQLSRKKGWRLPPNTIVVSRPGRWGNPFKVGEWAHTEQDGTIKVTDAKMAVKLFKQYLPYEPEYIRACLKGKNLACWCKLSESCHADVYLKIANT